MDGTEVPETMPAPIDSGAQVRVWWAPAGPTYDRAAVASMEPGAFYPAEVVGVVSGGGYHLRYTTGAQHSSSSDCIFPYDNSYGFGQEQVPFKVGEFVEASNDSTSKPLAWLGCVSDVDGQSVVVEFPFHSKAPATFPLERLRRSRFLDSSTQTWSLIRPFQKWTRGEIISPLQLEFITEADYYKFLDAHVSAYTAALALTCPPLSPSKDDAPASVPDVSALHHHFEQGHSTPLHHAHNAASFTQVDQHPPAQPHAQGDIPPSEAHRHSTIALASSDSHPRPATALASHDAAPAMDSLYAAPAHRGAADARTSSGAPPALTGPGVSGSSTLNESSKLDAANGAVVNAAMSAPAHAATPMSLSAIHQQLPQPSGGDPAASNAYDLSSYKKANGAGLPSAAADIMMAGADAANGEAKGASAMSLAPVVMWVTPVPAPPGSASPPGALMFSMTPVAPPPSDSWVHAARANGWLPSFAEQLNGQPPTPPHGVPGMPQAGLPRPQFGTSEFLQNAPALALQALSSHGYDAQHDRSALDALSMALPTAGAKLSLKRGRQQFLATQMPKKPRNGYLMFVKRHEQQLKEANPGKLHSQLSQTLSAMWKTADAAEKAECQRLAKEDKLRYEQELAAWQMLNPDLDVKASVKNAGIKKGLNAYVMFSKEFHKRAMAGKEDANGSTGELSEEGKLLAACGGDFNAAASTAWRQLTPEQKKQYKKIADDIKASLPQGVVLGDQADLMPSSAMDSGCLQTPYAAATSLHGRPLEKAPRTSFSHATAERSAASEASDVPRAPGEEVPSAAMCSDGSLLASSAGVLGENGHDPSGAAYVPQPAGGKLASHDGQLLSSIMPLSVTGTHEAGGDEVTAAGSAHEQNVAGNVCGSTVTTGVLDGR